MTDRAQPVTTYGPGYVPTSHEFEMRDVDLIMVQTGNDEPVVHTRPGLQITDQRGIYLTGRMLDSLDQVRRTHSGNNDGTWCRSSSADRWATYWHPEPPRGLAAIRSSFRRGGWKAFLLGCLLGILLAFVIVAPYWLGR